MAQHQKGFALGGIAKAERRQLTVGAAYSYLFYAKQDLIVPRDLWRGDCALQQRALLEIQRYGSHLATCLSKLAERAVKRRLQTGAQDTILPHNCSAA
jgi:hypothetical protein